LKGKNVIIRVLVRATTHLRDLIQKIREVDKTDYIDINCR